MPLAAGVRLGPYEILTLVGEGGMGEVYQARDTRQSIAKGTVTDRSSASLRGADRRNARQGNCHGITHRDLKPWKTSC